MGKSGQSLNRLKTLKSTSMERKCCQMNELVKIQELSDKVLICEFASVMNRESVLMYCQTLIKYGFKPIIIGRSDV